MLKKGVDVFSLWDPLLSLLFVSVFMLLCLLLDSNENINRALMYCCGLDTVDSVISAES